MPARARCSTDMDLFLSASLILALFFLVCVPGGAFLQEKVFSSKEMKDFAQVSLQGYVGNVLTEKNVANYGFQTMGEAQQSRLGDPLPLKSIALKDLKAYRSGAGLKSMPTDVKTTWYPVFANNEVRAKLEIIEKSGTLLAGGFGATNEAQRLSAVRQQIPDLLKSKNLSMRCLITIVKISALKATFLHVESVKGDFVVPAMFSPLRVNVKNGVL